MRLMTQPASALAGVGLLLFCLAGGCTSTRTVTVGPFASGDRPVIRRAPETGFYKVQWLSADRREIRTCAGSKRLIVRGEPVGVESGPDGQVTAIAGIDQFPLQPLPSGARYCQWQCTLRHETHLGMGLDSAGEVLGSGDATAAESGAASLLQAGLDLRHPGGENDRHSSRTDDHRDHDGPHVPASQKSE
jgi:hypothetical protein